MQRVTIENKIASSRSAYSAASSIVDHLIAWEWKQKTVSGRFIPRVYSADEKRGYTKIHRISQYLYGKALLELR